MLHQNRAEKKKSPALLALTMWESESVPILCFGWTNCFEGAWGAQEPNLCLITEVVISRILYCRVTERTSSAWFPLDLHCAWQQQDSLALGLKNTSDTVSMHSCEWGSTPVLVTGHAAKESAAAGEEAKGKLQQLRSPGWVSTQEISSKICPAQLVP